MDGWREVVVEWQGGTSFFGKNESGGQVQMGMIEGRPGISPMELVLVGLAGCTGVDVASILEKKSEPLQDLKIKVRAVRREEYPRIYTEIEIQYLLWGDGLDPQAVEKAIELSEEKYCSVEAMLSASAKISSSYVINGSVLG